MAIEILLADDDQLILEGLRIILESDDDFHVDSCFNNGREAAERCLAGGIDIALLDVRMPVMDGVEATKIITGETPTRVLILSTFDEDEYVRSAIKNGASGYLLKNTPPAKIMDALRSIYGGHSVIQDSVIDSLRDSIGQPGKITVDGDFTKREIDIIEEISEGYSNKEIASRLYLSEGTVKNYISGIMEKTGLKHRTQIAIAYLKGQL